MKSPSCCVHTISRLATSANEQRHFPESLGSRANREPAARAGHSSNWCWGLGVLGFPKCGCHAGTKGCGGEEEMLVLAPQPCTSSAIW